MSRIRSVSIQVSGQRLCKAIALTAIAILTCSLATAQRRTTTRTRSSSTPTASESPASVYQKNRDAIVLIEGEKKSGTGFLISGDGKVVTNYHVISGEKTLRIQLSNGIELECDDVLAFDASLDLAVVQLKGRRFKAVTIGDSALVSPGDVVVVISNPLGLEGSVTNGLVSGIRKFEDATFLQISAPVSPGSSGGPVFNREGKVIGIAVASIRGGQNLNLAIPSNAILELLKAPNPVKVSQLAAAEVEQPKPSPKTDLGHVLKYMQNEMWDDALLELKTLVVSDEFNPRVHGAIGECLIHKKLYDEAISQLQIARRLDPKIWYSTERLADAFFLRWITNKDLSDRVKAFELYEELISRPQTDDFEKLRGLVNSRIDVLQSPNGLWVTSYGERYRMKAGGDGWMLTSLGETKKSMTGFSTTPAKGSSFSGEGYSTFDPNSKTIITLSIQIRLLDHSSKLELDGFVKQCVGPPDVARVCNYAFRSGEHAFHMTFVRVAD